MKDKQGFALELLDRIVLHWDRCLEQSTCSLCCLYNLLIVECAIPINDEGEWVEDARQRWATRIEEQMRKEFQDFDTLEKPV